jgi:hypothetical protein
MQIGRFAESRTITQFECPDLSEKFSVLFRRVRSGEFLKVDVLGHADTRVYNLSDALHARYKKRTFIAERPLKLNRLI